MNFCHPRPGWTAVRGAFALAALAASVYRVIPLEILKLRRRRSRELVGAGIPAEEAVVDEGVARELETRSFPAVDPDTGEFEAIDPGSHNGP